MNTYRSIFLSLFTFVCASLLAQTKGVRILAKSSVMMLPCPEVQVDERTKKETVRWPGTNNDWIKDSCWAEYVHKAGPLGQIFPYTPFDEDLLSKLSVSDIKNPFDNYVPMAWMLTDEGNETVLHCYMRMPADEMTHLWVASEEACIVDRETGIQYRIRRTEPECTRRHLCLKAEKGEVIDLRIVFPPLPETVKAVTLFGVPVWHLVGNQVNLKNRVHGQMSDYDTIPRFRQPRLLQEHLSKDAPYDKQDWNTWRVYTDPHLIQPLDDYTMALWLTPNATYLATAVEQNWTREYFGFEPGVTLVDDAGQQYHLRELQGLPDDQIFFMDGNAGDYFAFMLVFDPMPANTASFSYIEPDGEPFSAWGANWAGEVRQNLDVQVLRANQSLFRYHPRVVVE